MRQQLTEPERRLWVELRAKQFHGAKFRRQQVIGTYIADFACRSPMLVIEVDGESHLERATYDAARTTFLKERGYRVLRFTNDEVTQDIEAVLQAIQAYLTSAPLPDPLP
jgi:very-short-patch-repair endonuclease